MARVRDYRAEYAKRILVGVFQGRSRSQARGHARSDEASIRPSPGKSDKALVGAAQQLARGASLTAAAKKAGVSAERLRRYVKVNKLAERHGRGWKPIQRQMLTLTRGRAVVLSLGFQAASLNGEYLNAVKRFWESNDPRHLEPFIGRSIVDTRGREHPLETRPNALYRLAAAGGEGFEQVYRLIA